ncbi:MAG TPA: hypothetical protein VFZ79_14970 [Acidimicrobiales bacterium]
MMRVTAASRVAIAVALAALALGCGNDDDGGGGGGGGGNATAEECRRWQDDFDAAEAFGDTDAMVEADERMRDGGCYG